LSGKNDSKEYVIVLIDACTKFVYLHHTRKIDSLSTVKALKSAIFLFGSPSRVIADQGRYFTGKEFQEFCQDKQIKLHLIDTGASRANGQVERTMGTLKNMFTTVETTERSWQDAIGEIQLALNCTTNRVTKSSPLVLLIGKTARLYGLLLPENIEEKEVNISNVRQQAVQSIENSAKYDKERFDKTKAEVVKFNVGDFVLKKNEERNQTKLDPKFRGPFVISEILEGDRYILKTLDDKRSYKYSHDRLKKMPDSCVPSELDVCDEGESSGHGDASAPALEEDHFDHSA
jgi:transposase InsO family protein